MVGLGLWSNKQSKYHHPTTARCVSNCICLRPAWTLAGFRKTTQQYAPLCHRPRGRPTYRGHTIPERMDGSSRTWDNRHLHRLHSCTTNQLVNCVSYSYVVVGIFRGCGQKANLTKLPFLRNHLIFYYEFFTIFLRFSSLTLEILQITVYYQLQGTFKSHCCTGDTSSPKNGVRQILTPLGE